MTSREKRQVAVAQETAKAVVAAQMKSDREAIAEVVGDLRKAGFMIVGQAIVELADSLKLDTPAGVRGLRWLCEETHDLYGAVVRAHMQDDRELETGRLHGERRDG